MMTPTFLIIISLLRVIPVAKSELLFPTKEDDIQASECLVRFMKDPSLQTMFVFEDRDYSRHIIQELLIALKPQEQISLNVGVQVCDYTPCSDSQIFTKVEQFFIFTKSAIHLHFILQTCICSKWWAEARFIIITGETADYDQMLITLERRFIFKALLVTSWTQNYVLFKYALPRCPEIIQPTDIQLYNCSSNKGHQRDIFKLSEIAEKCSFKVGVRIAPPFTYKLTATEMESLHISHPYVGFELDDLSNIVNISFNLSTSFNNNTANNKNTYTMKISHLIKSLVQRDIDLVVGALSTLKGVPKSVTTSYPYINAHLVAIVKKRYETPSFKIFKIFHWSVWLFVFIFVVAFVLINYILFIYKKKKSFNVVSIILHLFSVFTGQGTNFCKNYLILPLLSWIWITYFIRSSFDAHTKSFFFARESPTQVNRLKEICENNYKTIVQNYVYYYLKDNMKLLSCNITPKKLYISDDILKDVLTEHEDVVAFTYFESFIFEHEKYVDELGESPFRVIPELVVRVPLFTYFNENDPLKIIFHERRRALSEVGITKYNYNNHLKFKKNNLHPKKKALLLNNLIFCFDLYLYGVVISAVVFCLEFIYNKYLKNIPSKIAFKPNYLAR